MTRRYQSNGQWDFTWRLGTWNVDKTKSTVDIGVGLFMPWVSIYQYQLCLSSYKGITRVCKGELCTCVAWNSFHKSMGEFKKDITPLLMPWSYVFLALTHRNDLGAHNPIFIKINVTLTWTMMLQSSYNLIQVLKKGALLTCINLWINCNVIIKIRRKKEILRISIMTSQSFQKWVLVLSAL